MRHQYKSELTLQFAPPGVRLQLERTVILSQFPSPYLPKTKDASHLVSSLWVLHIIHPHGYPQRFPDKGLHAVQLTVCSFSSPKISSPSA